MSCPAGHCSLEKSTAALFRIGPSAGQRRGFGRLPRCRGRKSDKPLVPARVRMRARLRAEGIILARKIIAPRVAVCPEHIRTPVIAIVRIVGRRGCEWRSGCARAGVRVKVASRRRSIHDVELPQLADRGVLAARRVGEDALSVDHTLPHFDPAQAACARPLRAAGSARRRSQHGRGGAPAAAARRRPATSGRRGRRGRRRRRGWRGRNCAGASLVSRCTRRGDLRGRGLAGRFSMAEVVAALPARRPPRIHLTACACWVMPRFYGDQIPRASADPL